MIESDFLRVLGVVEDAPVGWVVERSPGWLTVGLVIARSNGVVTAVPRRDVNAPQKARLMAVAAQTWASGWASFDSDAWRYVERLGWVVDVLARVDPQAIAAARCAARWPRATVGQTVTVPR